MTDHFENSLSLDSVLIPGFLRQAAAAPCIHFIAEIFTVIPYNHNPGNLGIQRRKALQKLRHPVLLMILIIRRMPLFKKGLNVRIH
ncbi:hypothetical protein D3C78_1490930 [compost metagenome]